MTSVSFLLNGEFVDLEGTDPHVTLLDLVRDRGLTGTKEGCAEGDCGACTVVVREPTPSPHRPLIDTRVAPSPLPANDSERPSVYRAINGCLALAAQLPGAEVWTVEGVGDTGHAGGRAETQLHPVQEAIATTGGSQCGFCTPGFVMTMFASYYSPLVTDAQSADPGGEVLAGNLCRCTGYRALRSVAALTTGAGLVEDSEHADRFASRLHDPVLGAVTAELGSAVVAYRPSTLAEAIAHRASEPGLRVIAGATDVGVEVTRGFKRYPGILSLDAITDPIFSSCSRAEGTVTIGAGVTMTALEDFLRDGGVPLAGQMLPWFASRQIRNRATVGGNLMTASPIGDMSPVWLAHDAVALIGGSSGIREVRVADFFTGYRQTAVGADELLVALRIDDSVAPPRGRRVAWVRKVARRDRVDISTVAGAFLVVLDDRGTVVSARLAYGGVAATPVRALGAEDALIGAVWRDGDGGVKDARALLGSAFAPLSDHRGSASYRQRLITGLFDACLSETGIGSDR